MSVEKKLARDEAPELSRSRISSVHFRPSNGNPANINIWVEAVSGKKTVTFKFSAGGWGMVRRTRTNSNNVVSPSLFKEILRAAEGVYEMEFGRPPLPKKPNRRSYEFTPQSGAVHSTEYVYDRIERVEIVTSQASGDSEAHIEVASKDGSVTFVFIKKDGGVTRAPWNRGASASEKFYLELVRAAKSALY